MIELPGIVIIYPKYTYRLRFTKFNGDICTYSGSGNTEEEAKAPVLREAAKDGWTQPKWWQWWRVRDYN